MAILSTILALCEHAGAQPRTVQVETSANGPVSVVVTKSALRPLAAPRVVGHPNIRLIVTPIRMVDKANPAWTTSAALVIGHAGTNAVRTAPNTISSLSDYSYASIITWNDIVSNPDQLELWFLIRGYSTTGNNDVSLAGTTIIFESLSDGGVLTVTVTFGSSTYTPYAPLIMKDGSMVTSGSASVQGQRFSVLAHIKSFDGNSQTNLDSAEHWITAPGHMPYRIKCTAKGNDDSAVWRTVSTDAPFDDDRQNGFGFTFDASSFTFSVTNAYPDRFYTIWGNNTLGGWKDAYPDAVVYQSDSAIVPFAESPTRYYRAQLQ